MKKIQKGKILKIDKAAKDVYKMEFSSDIKSIDPGQFVSVLCPNTTLRRPFSVAGFNNGIITVLFKLKGKGTSYLSSLKVEDEIDFLGPLGNGFEIKGKKALLIGAGIGIAPMLYLKAKLDKEGIKNILMAGFKSMPEVIEGSDRLAIGGSVLDEVPELIYGYRPDIIYACGPSIVLEKTAQIGLEHKVDVQVAMEKVMACSIGVCRGCIIKVLKNGVMENASVCKDGPVFKGDEVVWKQ